MIDIPTSYPCPNYAQLMAGFLLLLGIFAHIGYDFPCIVFDLDCIGDDFALGMILLASESNP